MILYFIFELKNHGLIRMSQIANTLRQRTQKCEWRLYIIQCKPLGNDLCKCNLGVHGIPPALLAGRNCRRISLSTHSPNQVSFQIPAFRLVGSTVSLRSKIRKQCLSATIFVVRRSAVELTRRRAAAKQCNGSFSHVCLHLNVPRLGGREKTRRTRCGNSVNSRHFFCPK